MVRLQQSKSDGWRAMNNGRRWLGGLVLGACALMGTLAQAQVPARVEIGDGWMLQDAAKVTAQPAVIASDRFDPRGWYVAVVPGTVLTTLVHAGVYPEPLYGENNRPNHIPESLNKTSYWYRTVFDVPASDRGRRIWLNFAGINYSAEVWLNGKQVGTMTGAFKRGIFDVTDIVKPGEPAILAVHVSPQPHPGVPHEHTIADGMGSNGGVTALDGPTFLSTIGWDWIPAIRDRDTGIWDHVTLSTSGPVVLRDPLVTTDLPLPRTDSTDVAIQTTLANVTDQPVSGVLHAAFGAVSVSMPVTIPAHGQQTLSMNPKTQPALHVEHPLLWWPNGYGPQNLYTMHLSFEVAGATSDEKSFDFGVRKITYTVPDSENLTVSVNGVRVFLRGGDWGLDEAMKRIPRERLDAEIYMHKLANLNMIRNWVGQSTDEDFYELCDKYGILLWDEFFQPNPSDGPNPDDLPTYIANVRDKVLRYRNHPSIAIWCARNEGYPPKEIDDQLRTLLAEMEPTRLYQPSSTAGRGVNSGGPYWWRAPRFYYQYSEAFKTEIGSTSIPTMESVQGMMPARDWTEINDDWAEHDLARGASHGDTYPATLAARYGKIANMADFVRKSQLANYEAFRAMYEGREARLFNPSTAVLTWMSNPAQPSFVWQLYHHDLEPNSSLFAVKEASEMVHVQLNEADGELQVINNHPDVLRGAKVHEWVYAFDGTLKYEHDFPVTGPGSSAISIARIDPVDGDWHWPKDLGPVHFIRLELTDADGQLLSRNFYWRAPETDPDNLQAMDTMPRAVLTARAVRADVNGRLHISVTLTNPGQTIAVMAHVQLRRHIAPDREGVRVLPVFYSDNYVTLTQGESRTIEMDTDVSELMGQDPLIVVDGWNIGVAADADSPVPVELNVNAQVDHWPQTGLPIVAHTWKDTPQPTHAP